MSLIPGTRLGPYEISAQIGKGGMGEVYRARDTKLNRDVALKVLPADFALDPDRLARFKREAQVLASLDHPNIGAIHGFEETDGAHALVLQLVEGPTLADRIEQGPLPFDEALSIARQLAEALEAAHEKGVIHRDLKPANIKVREDGGVKVLDFGLAKLLESGQNGDSSASVRDGRARPLATNSPTITTPAATMAGMLMGTAAYMSPEQAKGRPADKRSDIWAFGCVLYEMLTGRRAFEGDDVSETLASVLKGEPDWTVWPTDAPAPIRLLVQRCLTKDPRARAADASVVRFILAEAANLAAPIALSARVPARTRPRVWAAVAVTALVAAAIGAAAAWRLRPAPARAPVVRLWLKLTEDERLGVPTGRQIIAISPDGTRTANVAGRQLWMRSLADFASRPLAFSLVGVHSPAFSPEGDSVVFFSDQMLRRVAISGGTPVSVCRVLAPFGVTWDASGILVGQGVQGIIRCPASGGTPERLLKVQPDEEAHGPQMLPDGRHLLFTLAKTSAAANSRGFAGRWDQAEIVVQDIKTGQRKTIVTGGSDGRYVETGHLLYAVGGAIYAAPFDVRRLETTGPAVPVLEGVGRARNAATGIAHVAISTGGTVLYVPGDVAQNNAWQLAIADRAGKVVPLKLPAGPYVHVRVSRDGQRLVLGSENGTEATVSVYDLAETTALRRLPLEGRNRFPIWSPDGERIAFQSDREGDLAIFTQRVDGTEPVERLTKPDKDDSHVPGSWSRDGKTLAFSAINKNGPVRLWTVSLPDKKAAPFGNVVSSVELLEPAFSPDGRWLAYSMHPPGVPASSPNRGVYIQPIPPTGAIYQAPKQNLDFQPLWSPDGHELFYVGSTASGRLFAVRLTTQPAVTFGAPESLPARVTADRLSNDPRAFDILPDGRFIGLIAAGNETPGQMELRIVINWTEELKQRVPTK